MLSLNASVAYKKDLKLCKKRGYNLAGKKECHILPDWLLIYQINGNELYLVRTGTHADLFGL